MKNNLIYLMIIALCALVIVGVSLLTKQAKPQIEVEKTMITLNCKTDYQTLLNYAKVDEGVNVIIQQPSLADIQRLKRITYVAIDENNQVSKLEVPVLVDSNINKVKLMTIKPLKMEIETPFELNDYFKLVDGCGNQIDETLQINNFDESLVGIQTIEISTLENPETIYYQQFEITSYQPPKLELTTNQIELDFASKFNANDYIKLLEGNFDQDISIKHNVDTKIAGEYTVDFYIEDIKGNSINKKLTVIVKNEEAI